MHKWSRKSPAVVQTVSPVVMHIFSVITFLGRGLRPQLKW